MKSIISWLCLVVLGGVLALPVLAQDDAPTVPQPVKMCFEKPHCGMPGAKGCPMGRCLLRCVLSILAVIHVLVAVWVYSDIRKRGEGHGVFIVLALLGGIPAAILYALVRLGDKKS
ncbi:MAG: hypothetical protein WCH84_04955 [Verrucomicrobiota bacterium]